MAVAVDESVEEPTEVARIGAPVRDREMLLVSLAELSEQPCPLERVQMDVVDGTGGHDRREDARHTLDHLDDLISYVGLAGADVDADATHLGVPGVGDERVSVTEEHTEQVAEVVPGRDPELVAVELPLLPVGEVAKVDANV